MNTQDLSQIKELFQSEVDILRSEFKSEISKALIDNNKNLASKQDVEELKKSTDIRFDGALEVIKLEIGDAEERIKSELSAKIDGNLKSNDDIAKKLLDNTQEQAAIIGGQSRMDDVLFDHGKRIIIIENKIAVPA